MTPTREHTTFRKRIYSCTHCHGATAVYGDVPPPACCPSCMEPATLKLLSDRDVEVIRIERAR